MSSTEKSRIDIQTEDGTCSAFVVRPSGEGKWPGVLFFMDALGVREALVEMAERLALNGYVVLLPDLYYRVAPVAPFDPKTAFAPGPEKDRLMQLIGSVDTAQMMRDTAQYLDTLTNHPAVAHAPIGCVGYCMGGRLALCAAGTFGERIGAAASFHGSRLVTDTPDSPHLLAAKARAALYLGVAGIDQGHTPETTRRIEEAFAATGLRATIELYPEVAHGFAVEDVPAYDHGAAERHWERLLSHFERALSRR